MHTDIRQAAIRLLEALDIPGGTAGSIGVAIARLRLIADSLKHDSSDDGILFLNALEDLQKAIEG